MRNALEMAAYALQCAAYVRKLDTSPSSTGVHQYAADSMAENAWEAFSDIASESDPAEVEEIEVGLHHMVQQSQNVLMSLTTNRLN